MQVDCSAIVLSVRRHGEGGAIVHAYTGPLGRVAGYVHGGASKRQASLWQPGNLVACHYTARSPSQLAQIRGEILLQTAAYMMERPKALSMVNALAALLDLALPEQDPHPELHAETVSTLVSLSRGDMTVAYLRWELCLLSAAGFGLDLSACALSGGKKDLAYVSPRTGRAVSAAYAGDWRDRLLVLPPFLLPQFDVEGSTPVTAQEACAGARLTLFFLTHHVFGSRHMQVPAPRLLLQDRFEKDGATLG